MKSTINTENQIDEIKYPFLGQNIDNGDVVLFKESGVGTIVYSGPSKFGGDTGKTGYHSRNFCMEGFKPFNGTVTLEND